MKCAAKGGMSADQPMRAPIMASAATPAGTTGRPAASSGSYAARSRALALNASGSSSIFVQRPLARADHISGRC